LAVRQNRVVEERACSNAGHLETVWLTLLDSIGSAPMSLDFAASTRLAESVVSTDWPNSDDVAGIASAEL